MNSIALLGTEFHRIYSPAKLFDPCERSKAPFYEDMDEASDEFPGGGGRYFIVHGASGHAQGNPGEGGDWSTDRTRLQAECFVTGAAIDSVVSLTEKFMDATKNGGAYSVSAEHDAVVEATQGLFNYTQRLMVAGHGTGRLAIVEANTVATDTFVAARPECAFQLRPNQPVDFYDLDTGGTLQATAIIESINTQTRAVVLDTPVTLQAGWGVYQQGVYGNAIPHGLRDLVDDGDYAALYCGHARTGTDTYLNATINDNGGALQDYSEELVRDTLGLITSRQDQVPTEFRSNSGIIDEHYRVTTADRLFLQTGATPPNYSVGANHENLAFTYGALKIPWKMDRDMPGRELFMYWKPGFRKHTLRRPDWMRAPGTDNLFQVRPAAGGDTYTYAYIATMLMDINISHRKPNANGAIKWIRDRGAARDV